MTRPAAAWHTTGRPPASWLDLTDTGSLLVEQAGGRRREIATADVFYLDR